MPPRDDITPWDFGSAISLFKTLSLPEETPRASIKAQSYVDDSTSQKHHPSKVPGVRDHGLGDFGKVWDLFSNPDHVEVKIDQLATRIEGESAVKEVRWRDEVSGADLEDNAEANPVASAGSEATRQRAERRLRARERRHRAASKHTKASQVTTESDTGNESGHELQRLRSSPVRRAVIRDILYPSGTDGPEPPSPPTSPSPPQGGSLSAKKQLPVSNPFYWLTTAASITSHSQRIQPLGGLTPEQRIVQLIGRLRQQFPEDAKYLKNKGIVHPEFMALNTSELGIHVFIDISNIMIGFHDCLKRARDISVSTRIRRVPMSFHNFSLIIERARPAAKRVLVGSDKFPVIAEAACIGYETNLLERVNKRREATASPSPHRRNDEGASGLSSGSESRHAKRSEKWVEQAVDEILHLKILESVIDAQEPSRIVLATGDAKEAEYSGGFLKMIERALLKGWQVEVISFRSNTSGAYRRKEFRAKWGPMFKWIQLDDFVEDLVSNEEG